MVGQGKRIREYTQVVDGAGLIACMMYRFESYCSRQLRGLDFNNQGIEMFDGTIVKNNRTISELGLHA